MTLPVDTSVWTLAQLCLRHGLTMLTTDQDFMHAAAHCPLKVRAS